MWITDWITRRIINRQRQIFRYFDGRKWRKGDPYRIWRAIECHEILNLETMADNIDEGVEPDCSRGLKAIREIFEVKAYDGKHGLMDWELADLLSRFLVWIDAVKKKHSPGLISSAPTGSKSSPHPEPQGETTNSLSGSHSTSNGSSYEKAGESSGL